MKTWHITNADRAVDLRYDTDEDMRKEMGETTTASPDFTRLRGPAGPISRRMASRKN